MKIDMRNYFAGDGKTTAEAACEGSRILEAHITRKGFLRVTVNTACHRCSGTGVYFHYGTCFRCGGTRRAEESYSFYTLEQLARMEERAERIRQKYRAAEAEKRNRVAKFADANPEAFWLLYKRVDNAQHLAKLADELWGEKREDFIEQFRDFDYNDIKENFDENRATSSFAASILHNISTGKELTPNQQAAIDRMVEAKRSREAEAAKQIAIGHFGEVGEKIEVQAEIVRIVSVEGRFGLCWIVGLKTDSGHALVYKGATIWWGELPVDERGKFVTAGTRIRIRAKIKSHDEYRGVPQTRIERVTMI